MLVEIFLSCACMAHIAYEMELPLKIVFRGMKINITRRSFGGTFFLVFTFIKEHPR